MLTEALALLVMINPFSLFIYLSPVMEELDHPSFVKVLAKASLISFLILLFFLVTGKVIFTHLFQINFESFRLFGGVVIFSYAWLYVVKGQLALLHLKEDLDDLASKIALPFMIGAGTISLAILLGDSGPFVPTSALLVAVLAVNYLFIMALKHFKENLAKRRMKVAFDKNMEILMRLNGFFIGAIGVDMMIIATTRLF